MANGKHAAYKPTQQLNSGIVNIHENEKERTELSASVSEPEVERAY